MSRLAATPSQFFGRAVSVRPLREQARRELVYRPLQFQKRWLVFIRTHNETLSAAMRAYDSPSAHSA